MSFREDIGEKHDLAAKEPERLKELGGQLRKVYAGVRAESPTWPAWEWPRYEAGRIRWPEYKSKQPSEKPKR